MKWSFSSHASFRKCPRQWFYKRVYANSRAKDSQRREAHRLSKLEGLQAWRGKIVDTIISDTIIPSIVWNRPCNLRAAKRKGDELFDLQRRQRLNVTESAGFFETEYGIPLTEEMFQNARAEMHTALENFYRTEPLWNILNKADRLIPQRSLSFRHGEVTVQVVPDLLLFRHATIPAIFDWKVNARPLRDYWLQLVAGAIAFSRCTPHRDWPTNGTRHGAHEIELLEIQLLTGTMRTHTATAEDVVNAEDFISFSATEMQLALGDGEDDLKPKDLPVAQDPKTCQTCPFKKMCWG